MVDGVEELADLVVRLARVAEGPGRIQDVVVAAPDLLAPDVAGVLEVGDDADRGALGDPDDVGDVTQTQGGLGGDRQQDVRGLVRKVQWTSAGSV